MPTVSMGLGVPLSPPHRMGARTGWMDAIHVFAQGWKNLFEVRLPAYLEQQEQ
jgi:hypothetical protein